MYAQRLEVGGQVDRSPVGADGEPIGFDLTMTGADPTDPTTLSRPAWTMAGADGIGPAHGRARSRRGGADRQSRGGLGLDLTLEATKSPALHDRDGWIDFGSAGGSYYYSRTAMTADGSLTAGRSDDAGGRRRLVRPPVGRLHLRGRRWLGLVRGQPRRRDGHQPVARARRRRQLSARLRHARGSRRRRASPRRRRVHGRGRGPAGSAHRPAPTTRPPGRSRSRRRSCVIGLRPTVAAQELDTRSTTGVVYWEGSQVVRRTAGLGSSLAARPTWSSPDTARPPPSSDAPRHALGRERREVCGGHDLGGPRVERRHLREQLGHPLGGRLVRGRVGDGRLEARLRRVPDRGIERPEIG